MDILLEKLPGNPKNVFKKLQTNLQNYCEETFTKVTSCPYCPCLLIDFSRILTDGWEWREGEGILGIFRCGEAANTGGGWMQISPPSCQHLHGTYRDK